MKHTNLLLAAAIAVMPLAGHAGEPLAAFDVAEDLSRFVFSAAPVFDDGMPAYGNAFVTQGYIYPAELVDAGVTVTRAVTGGTGDYDDAPAEIDQVMLGMSDGYGVRLSISFPGDDHADASGQTPTFAERDAALDAQDYGHRVPNVNDHTEWDSGFPVGPMPSLDARAGS